MTTEELMSAVASCGVEFAPCRRPQASYWDSTWYGAIVTGNDRGVRVYLVSHSNQNKTTKGYIAVNDEVRFSVTATNPTKCLELLYKWFCQARKEQLEKLRVFSYGWRTLQKLSPKE